MNTTTDSLADTIDNMKDYGNHVCQTMNEAIDKLGFKDGIVTELPVFSHATFSLTTDPYTADDNLTGIWYDKNRQRIGQIQFNSDGSFYAEYDIVQPHPTKNQWFVEGISAWGNRDLIKTEPKLLPSLA
ncbi:hypothetical protein [Methylophaga sp.]|uniref:hypothetical protein n=1 Tax=Methylophaga sp. TaxID=2024840 RepID=UPI002726F072|nr:hypothetical protein [Methylophaga sp.]MDO8828096.1 hypothetical protein [Methylophaga sp.]